ncbi:FkbM family methyltransferase [Algoriphagus boseongensis]|uniref:FkbM family methyltransferase n=1 Tax=Algoriphagus boseongensis TaxID=1442587 RepID=A0A4R6TDS4_9BACT|nr:FkbM family methyltransferase [Algoriphagus boseongensis]TDQ19584.1 FkbM family methyltransferase [Algoriphagus boseongensis]
MSFKKRTFHWITRQKRTAFGRLLSRFSLGIHHALENKINDNELSGEYWVLRKLAKLQLQIVFDVGANVGNWTKELKKNSPGSQVYLFEPVPETFDKLLQNLSKLESVYPNQLALSDSEGMLEFNFYPSQSYFSSVYPSSFGKESVIKQVPSTAGDYFCQKNQLSQIDLMKIDVEGLEGKVLAGFKEMIKNQKIRTIQFEYGPQAIDSKFLLRDFYDFFEENGYRVGKIYPSWIDWSTYSSGKENFILSNFLAVVSSDTKVFDLFPN